MTVERKRGSELAKLRQRIDDSTGERYWRSLEELAETPEFRDIALDEFSAGADQWDDSLSRRRFLSLMGASFALAGLAGCGGEPPEGIVPYAEMPEHLVPGKPLHFATAVPFSGFARGALVETHMGRPTRIEGNELHPSSLGGTDPFMQAFILGLYDPDRSKQPRAEGRPAPWRIFHDELAERRRHLRGDGEGLRILTGTITSPSLLSQLKAVLDLYPGSQWHYYDPVSRHASYEATRETLGATKEVIYDLQRADVIACLDHDLLYGQPGSVRYANDFAARRRASQGAQNMNRLYVCEPMPSVTGSMADHRLPIRPSRVPVLARALSARLGATQPTQRLEPSEDKWLTSVVTNLLGHRGRCLLTAGPQQPVEVHRLVHEINEILGNVGSSLRYVDAVAPTVDPTESLRLLASEMEAGQVDTLLMLETNPVYSAPADIPFGKLLQRVPFTVHLSMHLDETSRSSRWHLPRAHEFETWGDIRAHDGTTTIMQPVITPLAHGASSLQLLSALETGTGRQSRDLVRSFWLGQYGGGDFESFWHQSLRSGVVNQNPEIHRPEPRSSTTRADREIADGTIEISFRPDPNLRDGEYANNGWLQELPKPITKITWGNAAHMSLKTAERLGLESEQIIVVENGGRTVRAPVWVVPGHVDDCVTLPLGHGRVDSGRVAEDVGFSAYEIRLSNGMAWAGAHIRPTGELERIATTQHHFVMEGREPIREGTLSRYIEDPSFAQHPGDTPERSLYPEYPSRPHAWGMTIDLSTCIGCNGCVVACQAENNTPIVGKNQILIGREMHWLRVDRYFEGEAANPRILHQPVLCMHCEKAPCEPVCPVGATVHSSEGLNEMVYSRCIGTRYCSNNCPYKVRRFNFLSYADADNPSLLMRNPDVTVRSRGVMEKCTYCVQRISQGRIEAELEGRPIRDGEITTACQSACPTHAIVFGDLNDPDSEVSRQKRDPRNYALLGELNTRPRTTYLARIGNPAPGFAEDRDD
ncbi:MAG: TAT-variant-translocated molybdopterin oxidoreductase [Acidobacteria bacterium]|nr:TAT-variant-translocated molybdopterin oxidoreductase [Acidobacteriota bacterium]